MFESAVKKPFRNGFGESVVTPKPGTLVSGVDACDKCICIHTERERESYVLAKMGINIDDVGQHV